MNPNMPQNGYSAPIFFNPAMNTFEDARTGEPLVTSDEIIAVVSRLVNIPPAPFNSSEFLIDQKNEQMPSAFDCDLDTFGSMYSILDQQALATCHSY